MEQECRLHGAVERARKTEKAGRHRPGNRSADLGLGRRCGSRGVSEYPFTFIELRLDDHGSGERKLAVATRIVGSGDGRRLQLENYALQPIALNDVHRATH